MAEVLGAQVVARCRQPTAGRLERNSEWLLLWAVAVTTVVAGLVGVAKRAVFEIGPELVGEVGKEEITQPLNLSRQLVEVALEHRLGVLKLNVKIAVVYSFVVLMASHPKQHHHRSPGYLSVVEAVQWQTVLIATSPSLYRLAPRLA